MSKINVGESLFCLIIIVMFVLFCFGIISAPIFAETRKRVEFAQNCLDRGHSVDECERLLTTVYERK